MPFLAEELYQNLVRTAFPESPESVHLTDFPSADPAKIDKALSAATKLASKISSLGRAVRSTAGIKVRQPLAKVVVSLKSQTDREGLEHLKPQVLEELNVKNMEFVEKADDLEQGDYATITEGDITVAIYTRMTDELAGEGMAREIVHRLQTMRKSAGFEIADYIITYYQGDDYTSKVMWDFSGYIQQETLSHQLVAGSPEKDAFKENVKLSGHTIELGVIKD
jgi:isoleucyl-tRNA synthetase